VRRQYRGLKVKGQMPTLKLYIQPPACVKVSHVLGFSMLFQAGLRRLSWSNPE